MGGNALYVSGSSPVPNLDLTPFGFTISGIALIWGRFRFQLLDILPVARDTIVASLRDGVIVVDVQNRIVDLNPPAQNITGQTSLDIIGHPVGKALPGWPDTPVTIDGAETVSSEVLFGEGEAQRIYDLQVSPLSNWSGRSYGRLLVLRDVTDRRRAEKALQERTGQLELANKELEAFSHSVSHDLRAPLRGIDRFSQILLEDHVGGLDAQGQDYLQRVRAASQRMAQLIESLLDLSRTTRAEIQLQTVPLSGLAQDISTELQGREPERDVEFEIEEGVEAEGDMKLLQVVLENLMGNAWKYTSKHPRAKIEFGATRLNGERVYFVRDDGAGFDMAYADRLFGTFQRLHSEDEFKGDGIGLATVRRIIHRHGGRVWAEGAVEQGATFYFTLGTTLAPSLATL